MKKNGITICGRNTMTLPTPEMEAILEEAFIRAQTNADASTRVAEPGEAPH